MRIQTPLSAGVSNSSNSHIVLWLNKWELGETGFHQASINDSLQAWWPKVEAPPGGAVLVPLCGKSLDMCWLVEQGHKVVGLEISPLACEAFFDGLKLTPRSSRVGRCVA